MKTRLTALFLTLTLLLVLFAGCAKTEPSVSEQAPETPVEQENQTAEPALAAEPTQEPSAEPQEPSAEPQEPAEEAAPPEAEPEEPVLSGAVGAAADGSPTGVDGTWNPDGTYTSECGLTYPLADPATTPYHVEQWVSVGMMDQGIDDYNELPRLPDILEATGVDLQFHQVSWAAETEQFQLAVASGNLPEICQMGMLYTGGLAGAYGEEQVWDLTDYVEEYCPDWWRALNSYGDATVRNAYTSGMILQISSLKTTYQNGQGLLTRAYMLDAFNGGDANELMTLDAFTNYLKFVKDEYDSPFVAILGTGGAYSDVSCAFGTALYSVGGTSIATYLEDGTVVSGLTTDAYRSYLEWAKEMRDYGVFDSEFYNTTVDQQIQYNMVGKGQLGVWSDTAGAKMSVKPYLIEGAEADLIPLHRVLNEDGTYDMDTEKTLQKDSWSITSNADEETMKIILQFWNWFMTKPGYVLANWGVEAENADSLEGSFYIGEDGGYHWTTYVHDVVQWGQWQNTWSLGPSFSNPYTIFDSGDPWELEVTMFWTNTADVYTSTCDKTIPNGASLNSEESSQVASLSTDLCTYADEQILAFLLGNAPLNDETWAEFCTTLENSYQLSDIVAVYQNAYDEFISGNR